MAGAIGSIIKDPFRTFGRIDATVFSQTHDVLLSFGMIYLELIEVYWIDINFW